MKFAYQLQNVNIKKLASSNYDLIVIDNEHEFSEVKQLKPKEVIAYVSLGEAEDYRPYWNKAWKKNPPEWLGKENKEWKGNYTIKQFWHPEWWEITKSILDDVFKKGYDGIAIDKVDVYTDLGGGIELKMLMIDFIMRVSQYCKSKNPNFKIITHNCSELLDSDQYLAAIDGITQEDLIYDWNSNGNSGKQTPKDYQKEIISNLQLAKNAGKLVMILEYVSGQYFQKAKSILEGYQFISYSAPRDLGTLRNV